MFLYAQKERLKGFYDALKNKDLQYSVCEVDKVKEKLIPDKKNVFICANDFTAIRLYPIAKENGAGIIGFDNVDLIDLFDLPLDSVSYDLKTTVERIMQYLINGCFEDKYIDSTIIQRGSV